MRIAYLITRMDSIGGAQVHVRDMALAMHKSGHQVVVLYGGDGPFTAQLGAAGIACHPIPGLQRALHPYRDFLAFLGICRDLRRFRPEILSLHSSKAGWLGRVAGARLGIPTVFTAHGWSFSGGLSRQRTGAYLWFERIMSPWTRQLVCVSRADRELALAHRLAAPERIRLIHNGVPDIPPSLRARPTTEPPRLIMVARFQEPKDHAGLLRALAGLENRNWVLEFVGDGPLLEAVKAEAAGLGLAHQVIFSGECTDVAARLAKAQLFVLLSRREGFPRSILEAMRAGLPVIASDVGGIGEALRHEANGYLLPVADNGTSLRESLSRLLASPDVRGAMGAEGRIRYEREFSFPAMLEKTLELYRQLLTEKGIV